MSVDEERAGGSDLSRDESADAINRDPLLVEGYQTSKEKGGWSDPSRDASVDTINRVYAVLYAKAVINRRTR